MTYTIIALDFAQGLTRQDAASLMAKSVRAAYPSLKSSEIIQYPVCDGGNGTIELLVTERLGSFLEVEAKDASGTEAVVPLGFIGDDGGLAVISLGAVARAFKPGVGTTYGVGELIQDAIDERAFSILLGMDEPLACDYGLGIAAALGVKFFDSKDALIDLSVPQPDLLSRIHKIDASARGFDLLSARFHVARAASVPLSSPERKVLTQLTRISKLAHKSGATELNLAAMLFSPSMIEFGLSLFFNTEVKEGSMLVLEASMVKEKLVQTVDAKFCLIADSAAQLLSPALPPAVHAMIDASPIDHEITILTREAPSESEKHELVTRFVGVREVLSLAGAPLFAAPLRADSSTEEIRRDQVMRLEKLVPKLFPAVARTTGTIN